MSIYKMFKKIIKYSLSFGEKCIKTEYSRCCYDIHYTNCSVGLVNKAIIYRLYTSPDYRRKGYAKQILSDVIKAIREYGYIGNIYIEAIPNENSISKKDLVKFYEKMGLVILNVTENDNC